jgi:hypothetical protein
MKFTLVVPPILALVVVIGWYGSERYSISILEKESDILEARLTAHFSGSESDVPTSMQKLQNKLTQKNPPAHFKKLAALMAEVRRTGSKLKMMRLEQQCKDLTQEELISALDEIDGLDTPSGSSAQLKTLLFQELCQNAPESALARLADPSRSDRSEMAKTLASAMREWSPKDLAMAEVWFKEQIAAGKFDSTSLDGESQLQSNFEYALMGAWISCDPAAAAVRLKALTEDQRANVLLACATNPIKEEDQLAFANLVRTLAPENSRISPIASLACCLLSNSAKTRVIGKFLVGDRNDLPSDYTPVTEFFERIQATPEERAAGVEICVLEKIGFLFSGHLPLEKIDTIRAWAMEQAPGVADKVTSELLWCKSFSGSTFSEIAEMATQYSSAADNDGILFEFLSHKVSESDKGEARLLAEKITDPERRQLVLDGLK